MKAFPSIARSVVGIEALGGKCGTITMGILSLIQRLSRGPQNVGGFKALRDSLGDRRPSRLATRQRMHCRVRLFLFHCDKIVGETSTLENGSPSF